MTTPTGPVAELLPPKQREGESAAEYVERLEVHRSRLPADALAAPIRGHVAGSDGMKHWTKADYIGRAGTGLDGHRENPAVFKEVPIPMSAFKPLPSIRKRNARERTAEVLRGLTALAVQSYADGVMRLPSSVCSKLVRLGLYDRVEDARAATIEEVTQKFQTYARVLLEEAKTNSDLTPVITGSASLSQGRITDGR